MSIGELRGFFEASQGDCSKGGWHFMDMVGFEREVERSVERVMDGRRLSEGDRVELGKLLSEVIEWYGGVNRGATAFLGDMREYLGRCGGVKN